MEKLIFMEHTHEFELTVLILLTVNTFLCIIAIYLIFMKEDEKLEVINAKADTATDLIKAFQTYHAFGIYALRTQWPQHYAEVKEHKDLTLQQFIDYADKRTTDKSTN